MCKNKICNSLVPVFHEENDALLNMYMYVQGADDKLGQFLSQDIWATAYHRNCLQHSLESCSSLL
jgi:hypothetical protein